MAYFGLDLTTSEKRPSAYAFLNGDGQLESWGSLRTDDDILRCALEFGSSVVAVDCPLGLPLGLDCLEETHDCKPTSSLKGRECERELAHRGIPSYFTSKRSIIKAMVYRGIALKDALARPGVEVLEVYPYAVKVVLWGKAIPKKTTPEGLDFLRKRLKELVPGVAAHQERVTHDLCDALLAAYTAYLHGCGRTESLGWEAEVKIVVPKVGQR